MIGARDLAFPRLNLWSWYVYVIGGLFTLATLIAGGVDTGWTFYTPYSTLYSNSYVMLAVCGVFVVGFSSIFTAINFRSEEHTSELQSLMRSSYAVFCLKKKKKTKKK